MAPPARCAQALHFAKLRPPANRAYPLYAGPMPRKAPPARKQGPPAVRRPLVSQSHARPGGAAGPLYIGSPFHRGAAAGAHFSRAAGCVFSGKYAPAPSRLTTLAAPSARRAALPLQVTQAAFPHCGTFALSVPAPPCRGGAACPFPFGALSAQRKLRAAGKQHGKRPHAHGCQQHARRAHTVAEHHIVLHKFLRHHKQRRAKRKHAKAEQRVHFASPLPCGPPCAAACSANSVRPFCVHHTTARGGCKACGRVRPPAKSGACVSHEPRKGTTRTTPLKGPQMGWPTVLPAHSKPLKAPFLCPGILAARKRASEFLDADLACALVLLQLISDVLLYLLPVPSCCVHIIPSGPEMPASIFVLQICVPVEKTIRLLFPLRYPMVCAAPYLGGMLMSIWM